MTPEETKRWIWNQCKECGDCLIWQGAVDGFGTPMMKKGQPRTDSARRVLMRAMGKNTKGRIATTKCGDKRCMAEDHVVLWTRKQLQQRSMAKKSGDVTWSIALRNSGRYKLDMAKAREIRAAGMTWQEVMERYQVSKNTALGVLNGTHWKEYSSPFAGLGSFAAGA